MNDLYRSSGTYLLDLQEDESVIYEIQEHGRSVQFHKGKGGKRIITDLGRDKNDLKRAFDLLGNNVIKFDEKEKIVTLRPREKLVSVTQDEVSVTKPANVTLSEKISVTNEDLSVTRKCVVCGAEFTPKRSTALFCSASCRVKASRDATR